MTTNTSTKTTYVFSRHMLTITPLTYTIGHKELADGEPWGPISDDIPYLTYGIERTHARKAMDLYRLFTPPLLRRRGLATRLMFNVTAIAEKEDLTIFLVPAYNPLMEPCLSLIGLGKWYRRFGFVMLPTSSGRGFYMRRLPNGSLSHEQLALKSAEKQNGYPTLND